MRGMVMQETEARGWLLNADVDGDTRATIGLDHLPVGVSLLDHEFRFRRFNRTYADMFKANSNITAEEARGRPYFDCVEGSRDQVRPIMQKVLSTGQPYDLAHEELKLEVAGRTIFTYWDGQITPVVERSGHASGVLLACVEVERLRSLQPREGRFPTLGTIVPAGLLTYKEEQVVQLIREGLSSKQIAHRLNLSKAAIDSRRNAIRKKLGIGGQTNNLYRFLSRLH